MCIYLERTEHSQVVETRERHAADNRTVRMDSRYISLEARRELAHTESHFLWTAASYLCRDLFSIQKYTKSEFAMDLFRI